KNCRRFSLPAGSIPSKRTRTPPACALRVTTPFNANPFTQILPLATQSPISTLAPPLMWAAVSTWQPPLLVLERLPQMGASASLTRNSTATKHLILGCLRRSCPQVELTISGSNGGIAEAEAGKGCGGGSATALVEVAGDVVREASRLISRMAASRDSSRFSGGASR